MRDKEIKKATDSAVKGLHKRVMAGHSDNSLSSDLDAAAKALVSSGGQAFERADGMIGSVMTLVADEEEQADENPEEETTESGKRKGEAGAAAANKKPKKGQDEIWYQRDADVAASARQAKSTFSSYRENLRSIFRSAQETLANFKAVEPDVQKEFALESGMLENRLATLKNVLEDSTKLKTLIESYSVDGASESGSAAGAAMGRS